MAARSEGLTWSGFKATSTDRRCLLPRSPQSLECALAPVLQRSSLGGRDGACVQRRGQAPGRCGHRGNWWHSRSGDAGPGRFAPRGAHVGLRGVGLGRGPGTSCWDAPVSPPAGPGAPTPCWPRRWRFYDFTRLWFLSTESKIQTPVVLYAAGFLVRNSE